MLLPKVLWNSPLRGITPTFSGTTLAGKPPANAVDWLDFSYFEADSGNLDYTMTTDTDIDAFSVYVATFTGTGAETITLQYESSPSAFTTLGTAVNPAGGKLTWQEFTPVTVSSGRKIRFVINVGTGTLLIRQLVVGEALEMETGQFASMVYPSLNAGVKTSNTQSVNGSILGRTIKRQEKKGKLSLENLTASWVRSNWEPFAAHACRYAFIYAPNTRDYTDEISFATMEGELKAPMNTAGRGSRMSVEMPLRMQFADEFKV